MIWCVEDDAGIREIETYALQSTGFQARGFEDGAAFQEALKSQLPELIILDVMLPGKDGVTLLRELRAAPATRDIPVIMATARGAEYDKIQSLDLGADDYLVKPFSYPELLARVKGLLRRYQVYRGKPETVQEEAEWCGLRVSLTANMVWRNDRELDLTDTEWRILRMLVQNRGKIFSMENLYESVWKETYFPSSSNTVMVHIRRLREKVEDDPRHPEYIKTVWGKGYRVG